VVTRVETIDHCAARPPRALGHHRGGAIWPGRHYATVELVEVVAGVFSESVVNSIFAYQRLLNTT
jgi:hypothetical protein